MENCLESKLGESIATNLRQQFLKQRQQVRIVWGELIVKMICVPLADRLCSHFCLRAESVHLFHYTREGGCVVTVGLTSHPLRELCFVDTLFPLWHVHGLL